MHGGTFFYQAFVYLSAAVIAVPLAKKFGLGSVLGYLLAGVIIGPFALGLVGEEGQDVMHFAEFGVVMMLFLIGLELQPSLLWKMRASIIGLGGLQVGITAIVITAASLFFSPLPWQSGLAIGLTLALSSTAIVIQTLREKGLLKTEGGQNAFSVLLFQDIAVIPILALLPLLAVSDMNTGSEEHQTWVSQLPMVVRTVVVIGIIGGITLSGRYLFSPAFRFIAQTRLPELFTAAALLLIIGITLLMTQIGLSPALGTFLAGVVLAQSEYRHELESDIEPFKGLLLGLFFIAVGASIDFQLIVSQPVLILTLAISLIVIKIIVLATIGRIFGMGLNSNLIFTFALAQGGEFAFVLFSFAIQNGVIAHTTASPLIAAVAISMALTPVMMLINQSLILPRLGKKDVPRREADNIDHQAPVIIAGFGRYGSTIGRFLQANGIRATYLDIDPNNVDLLRKLGLQVFYGDASRPDLLRAAGAEDASLLIVAVDDPEKALEILKNARKYYPHLRVIARSKGWKESYQMLDLGITGVFREYLDSALQMASEALFIMGHRKYQVQRAKKKFRKHEEQFLWELAEFRHEHSTYISSVKQSIEDLEKMMLDDMESAGQEKDLGWDIHSRKEDYEKLSRKNNS